MFKSVKTGLGLACVLAVMAGCSSTDTDDSASANQLDQTPPPVVEDTTTVEAPVALDNVVYFDFDQSLLKPSTRELLIKHADRMRGAAGTVRLEGHADELGTREYNLALGERRANAVRDFLVLQGVNAANLEVISYGEERPASEGSSESDRAMNRRVVIN
ncbi:OmpA family protein [Microbulbifer harenosus]|uniref:Peptidoglycan-associated lipoprotein n=1 Tax=Microbulbifer harenosus TaxID=2576840 RepID=A0ABY2UGG8_9GAMM|nr:MULTISPECIES: OmpA family protein [Microbulbifer]QIL91628.1 OmpA family protein [Microbulbifer sp. SH-1]TLM76551.1 peptidoglycan-associated lipoprotein [Microbulbifer harenosus]